MPDIKISIIAAAIRTQFFKTFLDSLKSTSVAFEVVFGGHCTPEEIKPFLDEYPFFRYIHTGFVKPAQVYEVCRRAAIGELISWSADDCEHTEDLYGKAYAFWKDLKDEKVLLSIQTFENGQFCNMNHHAFFGWNTKTPIMAPLGMMSRSYLEQLGGFDRRYVCGQYENSVAMCVYADGGRVVIFGDLGNRVDIDHYRKHGIKRPFATGYNTDREVLESSWTDGNKHCVMQRVDKHEPYDDKDILTVSQSNKGQWS